jgi:hypothetical protein
VLRWRTRHGNPDRKDLGGIRHSLALLPLALVALAGCGDDDADQTFPPGVSQPLEKVEFLAEADRICHSTNARVEAAADDLFRGGEPPPAQTRRVVIGVAIPALEAEVRAIRALGAPAGDEREVDAIVDATERGIAEIRADPVAALDRPPARLREAGRLARAYGSRECGVPSG